MDDKKILKTGPFVVVVVVVVTEIVSIVLASVVSLPWYSTDTGIPLPLPRSDFHVGGGCLMRVALRRNGQEVLSRQSQKVVESFLVSEDMLILIVVPGSGTGTYFCVIKSSKSQ